MSEPTIKRRNITDYIPDDRNANDGNERGLQMIENSLQSVGPGRSLVADKNDRIPAGNKTLEAAVNVGITEVIEIETDGDALIVHKRRNWDLSDPKGQAREYAYFDNRSAQVDLTWSPEVIAADIQAGADLTAMFTTAELIHLLDVPDVDLSFEDGLTRADVPDALFLSDNEWGVPTLDIALQATTLDLPFSRWGKTSRKGVMNGTYHFYEDDYKFEALWSDPSPLINSKCKNAVEPNVSTNNNMPRAVVLNGIYRKRWIARYWQQYGVKIFVDLNIETEFADLALLGVPSGWKAYCNRGYGGQTDHLDAMYALACERAGDKPLYVVYGGGKTIADYCRKQGWLYIKEDAHETEGRDY